MFHVTYDSCKLDVCNMSYEVCSTDNSTVVMMHTATNSRDTGRSSTVVTLSQSLRPTAPHTTDCYYCSSYLCKMAHLDHCVEYTSIVISILTSSLGSKVKDHKSTFGPSVLRYFLDTSNALPELKPMFSSPQQTIIEIA